VPFLIAILISGKGHSVPGRSAALAASLVFCGLLAAGVPMRYRADRQQSLGRSDALLAQLAKCGAQHALLGTDSPTLNQDLMKLAVAVSASAAPVKVDTLVYSSISGARIEADFRAIRESDQIVFQDGEALWPPFTNQRASEYERYTQQLGGYVLIRVGEDVSVYSKHCGKQ
jgi:hypothetical protein